MISPESISPLASVDGSCEAYCQKLGHKPVPDWQGTLIRAWADNGAPEGDPNDKPPMPAFTDGWQAGKPDQILTLSISKPSLEDVFIRMTGRRLTGE